MRNKYGTAMALVVLLTGSAAADINIGDLDPDGTRISGTVAEIFGNKFVLEDETGRILVEAGPWFHQRLDLSEGERIDVIGEVDRETFDAFSIVRADGEVLKIRSPEGPPPWAGTPPWAGGRGKGGPPEWAERERGEGPPDDRRRR